MTARHRLYACLFLVAFALLVGTRADESPQRVPAFRAGYRLLEADFHAHTRFSDGFLSPFDLVVHARRQGLDVLAVTEHNGTFPAEMARWFAGVVGGPTVIVGEEITTNRFHLIAVGLRSKIVAGEPLSETIDAIHAQGGIAIAAHPVEAYWERFGTVLDKLDGAEVMHPLAYGASRNAWRWEHMREFYERARKSGRRLTAIGSSDYHFGSVLGITRTLVFAENDEEASVLEALRRGRTVVYDLEGHAYGDPALIAALEGEPYALRPVEYGYRSAGALDRLARLLGLLGLVGLVTLARPRREA